MASYTVAKQTSWTGGLLTGTGGVLMLIAAAKTTVDVLVVVGTFGMVAPEEGGMVYYSSAVWE